MYYSSKLAERERLMKVGNRIFYTALLLSLILVCGNGRSASNNMDLRGTPVLQGLRDLLHQKHPFFASNIRDFLSVPIGDPNCVLADSELKLGGKVCFSKWSNKKTGAYLKLDFRQSQSDEIYDGTISLKPSNSICLKVEQAELIFARPFKIDHMVVQEPKNSRTVPPIYKSIEYTDFDLPSYIVSIEVNKSCITSITVKTINDFKELGSVLRRTQLF